VGGCKALKVREIAPKNELKYTSAVKQKFEDSNRPENILLKNALLKIEDENKTSLRLTFFMKRETSIYVNGRYLGFEIFRLKLTRDSVYFINRINKNYFFGPKEEIRNAFVRDLNLYDIQEIIYTGLISTEELNNSYIENHFTPDVNSIHYTRFIDDGIKLEMEYDPLIYLEEIVYSNHQEKVYLNIDLDRERDILEGISGSLFRESGEIKWSLDLNDISYEKYNRTSFNIGNNYNEVKSIF
jgi:hypothetical protein